MGIKLTRSTIRSSVTPIKNIINPHDLFRLLPRFTMDSSILNSLINNEFFPRIVRYHWYRISHISRLYYMVAKLITMKCIGTSGKWTLNASYLYLHLNSISGYESFSNHGLWVLIHSQILTQNVKSHDSIFNSPKTAWSLHTDHWILKPDKIHPIGTRWVSHVRTDHVCR